MKYLILGNGIAGVRAAEAIRSVDAGGGVTMVGDEDCIPYSRPLISMLLARQISSENLPIRPPDFYQNLQIETVFGKRASAIDPNNKQVYINNGDALGYDKLLIATGADPRTLEVPGADLQNIFYMRTERQVNDLLAALPHIRNALVLGGGLVGFKAAYGLMRLGIDTTMLITSEYPLALQVDAAAGKMILDELLRNGLKVKVGVSVQAFDGEVSVNEAILSNGEHYPCDLVVIGKGVKPALSFAPKDQIRSDLGVLVDEYMQTNVPDIYAAGDAAEAVDIARQIRWVNAIWPEAAVQGEIAGLNMAGRAVSYEGSLSRNVMRILDLDVMTLGWVNPPEDAGCESVTAADPRYKTYRKLVFRKNVLIGAMLVNRIEQGGLFLKLIQNRTPLKLAPEALLAPSFNFRQLLI